MGNNNLKADYSHLTPKDKDLLQQAKDRVNKCIQEIKENVIRKEREQHRLSEQR